MPPKKHGNITLKLFCRQIRRRSAENRAALTLLHQGQLYGNVVSILRQELDSLVRAVYLLAMADRSYRSKLIQDSVEGKPWTKKNGKGRITDREMVEFSAKLHGWAKNVYQFGCAFIHLSSFHDYPVRDPMVQISRADRSQIAEYISYYHGVHVSPTAKFSDIVPLLPRVFDKISSNLECYVKALERDEDLEN